MIATILSYLVFLGIIYSILKVIKSNENSKTKIIVVFVLSILLVVVLFFSFVYSWKRGGPNREPRELYEDSGRVKIINIYNNTKKLIDVKINFKYTKDEIKKYKIENINLKKDTIFYVNKGNGGNFMLPIPYKNSVIKFPKSFSIQIKDSVGKIIETYNKEEFFKNIERSSYNNINDIESKEEGWTLIIN